MRKPSRRIALGVVSIALGVLCVGATTTLTAFADSPSPNTSTVANVAVSATGVTTVTLSGTWAWPTHLSNCNTDRFAMGWQAAWSDPNDPGFSIGGGGGPGGGLPVIGVGSQGNALNPTDNSVHYFSSAPRCGTYDASLGYNTGSWGPIEHVYETAASVPSEICVVLYDLHGQPSDSAPQGNNAIAGGAGHNADNSYEGNGVANSCGTVSLPKVTPPTLRIVKTAPATAQQFSDVTYDITVSNDGTVATDHPLVLNDPLPAGATFVSLTPPAGWSCPTLGQTISCTYASPLASMAAAPTIAVVAQMTKTGSITNTASVLSQDIPIQYASATTLVTAPPPGAAQLTLAKTAMPASGSTVTPGQTITYTLSYANSGGTAVTPATITDTVPAGTSYSSGATCSPACAGSPSFAAGVISWPVNVAAGGSGSVSFPVTVDASDTNGQLILNHAVIVGGGQTITSNTVSHTVSVPAANLTLVKAADPASGTTVHPGDRIGYTLTYGDTGALPVTNATISDVVPVGTAYLPGSANCSSCTAAPSYDPSTGTLTWTVDVAAGGTGTVGFAVTVDAADASGTTISNLGTITGGGSTVTSNTVHNPVLVPAGSLGLVKSVSPTTATAGSLLTYTLDATASAAAQTGVVVSDQIPVGTTYVAGSATCPAGCTAAESPAHNVVSWYLGSLQPGQPAVPLSFQVTVNTPPHGAALPANVTNVAMIKSTSVGPTPSNVVTVPLTPLAVLGEQFTRTPTTPTTVPTEVLGEQFSRSGQLPFTGQPLIQELLIASVLIGGGLLLLTWPRLRRAS